MAKKLSSINSELDKLKCNKADLEHAVATGKASRNQLEKEKENLMKEKLSLKQVAFDYYLQNNVIVV